eukprot:1059021-Prorocentrum_minimum.AAC.1
MSGHPGVGTDEGGLFVYKAKTTVGVRSMPDVGDAFRLRRDVQEHELVAVDMRRFDNSPGCSHGPFLRLSDCSGWLFERKEMRLIMEEVPTEAGLWAFRVNEVAGLTLRRHPTHSADLLIQPEKAYPSNFVIWADLKVESNGETFVHVQGTNGWLYATSGGQQTLVEVDPDLIEQEISFPSTESTTKAVLAFKDSVRELAREHGYTEVHFCETGAVVVFFREAIVNADMAFSDTSIRVYYTTGTVVTILNHPQQGKSQRFRWNCSLDDLAEIFANPSTFSAGSDEQPAGSSEGIDKEIVKSEEITMREALVEVDAHIKRLMEQRADIMQVTTPLTISMQR